MYINITDTPVDLKFNFLVNIPKYKVSIQTKKTEKRIERRGESFR